MADPDRWATVQARARFDRPELAPLWQAARRRFERSSTPVTTLRLRGLSVAQQTAVAELLGLVGLPGPQTTVPLRRLDAVLRSSPVGLDTRGVVEAIGGPITDRTAARAAEQAAREQLWRWLATHPTVAAQPALQPWVAAMRSGGLADGSVTTTRAVLESALRVLAALPADGRPLASFADQVCHDPHGLDDGTRLSHVVLRALATIHEVPSPTDAAARRRLWELAGVACDGYSTSVLVAGLRPAGDDPLATTARVWAQAGQASWVTLAQLHAATSLDAPAGTVRVVENPSVLAEALTRFGPDCPPLVCTSGWPNTAAVLLLRRLAEAGCTLVYHGDFDGEGLRIAAYVMAKTGATPWRMAATDYRAAVSDQGPPVGRVTEAPWDSALAAALRTCGVAVPEERVVPLLLADLAASR